MKGFLAARTFDRVALDPSIGEVDAEHGSGAIHGRADVDGTGGKLRVDESLAFRCVAVLEFEDGIVDERLEWSRFSGRDPRRRS